MIIVTNGISVNFNTGVTTFKTLRQDRIKPNRKQYSNIEFSEHLKDVCKLNVNLVNFDDTSLHCLVTTSPSSLGISSNIAPPVNAGLQTKRNTTGYGI